MKRSEPPNPFELEMLEERILLSADSLLGGVPRGAPDNLHPLFDINPVLPPLEEVQLSQDPHFKEPSAYESELYDPSQKLDDMFSGLTEENPFGDGEGDSADSAGPYEEYGISRSQKGELTRGLKEFARRGRVLEDSSEFSTLVPLAEDSSQGGLSGSSQILDSRVSKPVFDYFNDALDPPSAEGVLCTLQDTPGRFSNLPTMSNSPSGKFVPANDEVWPDSEVAETRGDKLRPDITAAPTIVPERDISNQTPLRDTCGVEMIFIDPRVENYQDLIRSHDENSEAFVLDGDQDGVQQIAEILSERREISALHIISHGEAAQVTIGTSMLDLSSLDQYVSALSAWGEALTEDGDILFYACNLARGEGGLALVQEISNITGADVAASTDNTGSPQQGGDWILEAQTGPIGASWRVNTEGYDSVLADPDRLEGNNDRNSAAAVGVGPGVHFVEMTIHDATDEDWYGFKLLHPDDVDVTITFSHADGDLSIEVTDSEGAILGSSASSDDNETVSLNGLAPGNYYAHIYGESGATNTYDLTIDPGPGSATKVYYINDGDTTNDFYAFAPGNDASDGLTPSTPKATVQRAAVLPVIEEPSPLVATGTESPSYLAPLRALPGLGSLIFDPPVAGTFDEVGEFDTYTINLDGGQTLTLLMTPQDPSILGQIEVLDPDGISLGNMSAGAAGEQIILQTVPITAGGNYTFLVASIEGTGAYEAEVFLNSALETESYGGPTDDTLATAQDLNASAVALQGTADRLAVVGRTEAADDFFRFDLAAGQAATLVLTRTDGIAAEAALALDQCGRSRIGAGPAGYCGDRAGLGGGGCGQHGCRHPRIRCTGSGYLLCPGHWRGGPAI